MTGALLVLVLAPFAGALVLGCLSQVMATSTPQGRLQHSAWIAGTAALIAAFAFALLAPSVFDGEVQRMRWEWLPALGVGFGLRMDGLALMFAGLIVGIGLLVVLYARWYLSPEERTPRFFALLLAFMGAMLGIALSDNLILLAIFWELTSLTSFLLIGFWQHRADAREGARMALTVTGTGGLALLAGVLLLGWIAGGWDLDTVLAAGDRVRAHALYPVCLLLILAGAFTKSAQFPVHFWLPHAMAAPTPVSAYLHSATMVKAGLFLMARLYPTLSGTDLWFYTVTGVGAATLLTGAWHAIFQHDLKGLLAYSTISHLGLITMLFGLDSPMAAVAAVFHLLNHATFKASLFMAAGIIDHETGTRDMRRINGLRTWMPVTATLAIVASAAMAGVPLLNGFLSKEMFLAETLAVEGHRAVRFLVPAAAALATALSVAYSVRFIHDVFFNGEPVNLPRTPHEPPHWMRVPVELLVVLCLLVGLLPSLTVGPLLALASRDVLGGTLPEYSLAIWHGFNAPLAFSLFALAGGTALYFWLARHRNLHEVADDVGAGKRGFERAIAALLAAARALTAALEGGGARRTLLLAVGVAVAAGALPWMLGVSPFAGVQYDALGEVSPGLTAVWAVGAAATLGTVAFARQRLVALVAVGAVGLVVSLAFVWFGAPDLALTQLLVEVATTLLMMLSLRYLPPESPREPDDRRKLRDAGLAAVAGIGLGAIAWAVMVRPFDASIAPWFIERTLPEGGGTNAVNVIIVDFRGLDTFGEMTVMLVAGLVIHALIARITLPAISGPARATGAPGERRHPLMFATLARALLPFAMLVSAYFFLRGHNLPGGGFIAGLIAAIALLMQSVAAGPGAGRTGADPAAIVARRLDRLHLTLGAGLLIACLTGLGAWLFGYPFLTSTFAHPVLPWVGELPLASAAAFDFGVFLAVVGATVLALTGIGRLARRER
ncbi:MAG: monovalent cation/H+ antiporter subunit A [Burkholderiales bacterium]|nr:monovalent cation/H+ antiporter subunit A [Burkholderiales bacterium]